ncbi:MAG: Ig-like domain-containing protein, partial [Wenzhouxiangella sp.]
GNTATVEFVEITPPVDAEQSTVTVDDDTLVADGADSTTVTIQIRDADGDPIERAGVSVSVSAELGSLAETSGSTDADGRFTTTLTAPASTGTDTISGRVLGEEIGNTAQVEYIAGTAAGLRFAEQPAGGTAGETFSASVEVIDANGNLIGDADDSITLQLTQPDDATLSGTTTVAATGGTASFGDLSIDLAGDYTLTASASGLDAAVSDSFGISAGEATGQGSEISADPEEIEADGVSAATITVQALDEFGNPVAEPGLAVTLSTTLGSLAETSGTTDADGRFVTTLTSTETGTAEISGTLDGDAIDNTASVEVVAASVSAGDSTIETADDRLEADGESSTTVTVQARDAGGNPVSEAGLAVTLSTTLGSLADDSGSTDADGRFVTTLTSEPTIGTAEISGTLGGEAIGDTASVLFVESGGGEIGGAVAVAFDIEPVKSVQHYPLNGEDGLPVTVGFVDAEGTPIESHNDEITIEIDSGPEGAVLGGTTTRTSQNGFVVFDDITLDTLGSYTLRASAPEMSDAVSEEFQVREESMFSDRFEATTE